MDAAGQGNISGQIAKGVGVHLFSLIYRLIDRRDDKVFDQFGVILGEKLWVDSAAKHLHQPVDFDLDHSSAGGTADAAFFHLLGHLAHLAAEIVGVFEQGADVCESFEHFFLLSYRFSVGSSTRTG